MLCPLPPAGVNPGKDWPQKHPSPYQVVRYVLIPLGSLLLSIFSQLLQMLQLLLNFLLDKEHLLKLKLVSCYV